MRILCVCDHGSSRSVHIADQLRYRGHETIPVGASKTTDETRTLLSNWADVVIFTDPAQQAFFPETGSTQLWPIADQFPRPYNPELLRIVRDLVERSGL